MSYEITYTAKAFLKIVADRAQRGHRDPALMFPVVAQQSKVLARIYRMRRSATATLWTTKPEAARIKYGSFRPLIKASRKKKLSLLESELERIAAQIAIECEELSFRWGLHYVFSRNNHDIYGISDSPAAFFAMKQTERNIRLSFGVESAKRNRIVNQFVDVYKGTLPKYVYRTDIASFFSSIPHCKLVASIANNPKVSATTAYLISVLLDEWQKITGSATGIPAGVGLSSYLAEVFAQQIDDYCRTAPGVRYFARYVDDIILVATSLQSRATIVDALEDTIAELGLSLNASKTQIISPGGGGGASKGSLEFLGYRFYNNNGQVSIRLANKKLKKFRRRLKLAFEAWDSSSQSPAHQWLLANRLKFLSTNTKLTSSHGIALVGIYYNYPALTDLKDLRGLDCYVKELLRLHPVGPALHDRLMRTSFVTGHQQRVFSKYKSAELGKIVRIWSNA